MALENAFQRSFKSPILHMFYLRFRIIPAPTNNPYTCDDNHLIKYSNKAYQPK